MDASKKKGSSIGSFVLAFLVTGTIVWVGYYMLNQQKKKAADATAAKAKADALKQLEDHFDAVKADAAASAPPAAPAAPAKPAPAPAPAPTAPAAPAFAITAPTPAPAPAKATVAEKLKDAAPAIAGTIAKQAIAMALPKIIYGMVEKKLASKVASRSLLQYGKFVSKKLAVMGAKVGEKVLARLGLMAAKKAGAVATQLAAQSAIAADTGPAAPFVEAAFLAFDVLSMSLDMGDAGGYGKLSTIESYLTMKTGVDAEVAKSYKENGIDYPAIVGPLDKLAPEDFNKAVSDQVKAVLAVPDNIYMKAVMDAVAAANLTDASLLEQFITDHSDLIDMDGAHTKACDQLCVLKGGMVLGSQHYCSYKDKASCEASYTWPLSEANKDVYAEFHADAGGPGQAACISASAAMRGICSANNLPYNSDRGICAIDEKYCLTKSAEWKMNPKIKENDCMIPAGQQVLAAIFGTTITSGLNQIFNFDQYTKCPPGAVDDGYSCRVVTCGPGLEAAGIFGEDLAKASTALIASGTAGLAAAGTGSVLIGLGGLAKTDLCYRPCRENFEGDSLACWQKCPGPPPENLNCKNAAIKYLEMYPDVKNAGADAWGHFAAAGRPEGRKWPGATCDGSPLAAANTVPSATHNWHDDGASCRLTNYCPPGKDHQLALCYNTCTKPGYSGKLNNCVQDCPVGGGWKDDGLLTCFKPEPYGRGVGTIPLKRPCAAGLRDDGTSCWKDDVARGAGRIPDKAPCPPGMRDDKTSCWSDDTGRGVGYINGDKCRIQNNVNCKKCIGLWYPPCPPAFSERGCNLCSPPGGAGVKKTLFDRQSCRADEEMQGALCYPKCPPSYNKVGFNICSPPGGPGIRTTLFDRQYCADGQELIAGLCYVRCKPGYHNVGTNICSPDCPQGMTDLGISCGKQVYARDSGSPDTQIKFKDSYFRGLGEIPKGIKISLKKRSVPFSNKKN